MFSDGSPHMADQKQSDQLKPTYSSSVRIRDVAQMTSQKRWTIGRSSEKGSGISVLVARQDDAEMMWRYNWNGLVSLFNGISYGLFNATVILVGKATMILFNALLKKDKGVHIFFKRISSKVNVKERLEFEHAYPKLQSSMLAIKPQDFSHSK